MTNIVCLHLELTLRYESWSMILTSLASTTLGLCSPCRLWGRFTCWFTYVLFGPQRLQPPLLIRIQHCAAGLPISRQIDGYPSSWVYLPLPVPQPCYV